MRLNQFWCTETSAKHANRIAPTCSIAIRVEISFRGIKDERKYSAVTTNAKSLKTTEVNTSIGKNSLAVRLIFLKLRSVTTVSGANSDDFDPAAASISRS